MQELWNTCDLLEVRWDNPVGLKCQYLSVFAIFCHAAGGKKETLHKYLYLSLQNRKNFSPEASTSLPYGDTKNFVFNPDCYGCILLFGEFSHKPTCPSGREYLHHCQWNGTWDHSPALGGKSVAQLKELAHSAGVTWLMLLEEHEGVFTGAVLLPGQWQQSLPPEKQGCVNSCGDLGQPDLEEDICVSSLNT